MKRTKSSEHDKVLTSSSTSGSFGLSTSSNLTVESSDIEGDGSDSLIPEFLKDKSWSSKTTATFDDNDE
ncbi:hypothetical protein [Clostridium folliculivorans]|uniref:Uncharacterized protein n=1 Tax=Clostridium folliculivorans TaxID=2886038 RepID=A0A9W5Y2K0_9CLOT|nr:hypothetical protein [Clostridium folliculivorans]GKU25272.1 hypothetical protein CFOLD11_20980 [Clostridium folliculivorans]GKU28293.1 hypothetical protein CFB3_03990 [Clostridium folliculivorans]